MTRAEAAVLDRVRRAMNRDREFNRRLAKSDNPLTHEAGYRVTESLRAYQHRLKPLFALAAKTLKETT